MKSEKEIIEKVESLQNLLLSYATGGPADADEYQKLRGELTNETELKDKLPRYIHTC
jgi:hypothetical protein